MRIKSKNVPITITYTDQNGNSHETDTVIYLPSLLYKVEIRIKLAWARVVKFVLRRDYLTVKTRGRKEKGSSDEY